MNICLENTERTQEIINTFVGSEIECHVDAYSSITFIKCDLEANNYSAIIMFYAKELVIFERLSNKDFLRIPFEEINCVYDLD